MPRSSKGTRRVSSRIRALASSTKVRASLFTVLTACSSGPDPAPALDALRISSSSGLAELKPGVDHSISALLIELVCPSAGPYLTLSPSETTPDRLVYAVHPRHSLSTEELAQTLRAPGIIDAHAENGRVVARREAGSQVPSDYATCLDIGPYRVESYSPDRLVLARRSGRGMPIIEVRTVGSEEEEWRRFLAREVDVVPEVRRSLIKNLSDVPSVRLVSFEKNSSEGLIFRCDRGPFADVRLRRVVSLAVRRRAIARAIFGDDDAAAEVTEDASGAARLLQEVGDVPLVRLTYPETFTESQRAAMVIEQQLAEVGLRVKIDPQPMDTANEMVVKGEFDAFLMAAGFSPSHYWRVKTGSVANVTGYSNADLDQAIERGDHAKALEILQRDLPMTPLFFQRNAIAVDRRFCGAHPRSPIDITWLADIHVCVQGETE